MWSYSSAWVNRVDMDRFEILRTFDQTTDAIYTDGDGGAYFVDYNDPAWYRIDVDTGELTALGSAAGMAD